MYREERIAIILEYLNKHRAVSVSRMAKEVFMSEATVRRDLEYLQKNNIVKRTHGGAVLYGDISQGLPFFIRKSNQAKEKTAMAETAAGFVKDGDIIFMDDSTSCTFIIEYLKPYRNLRVVTNSLKTAIELCNEGITVYITGGRVTPKSFSCLNEGSTQLIEGVYADVMFFSTTGLAEDGDLTDSTSPNTSLAQTQVKQAMLKHSKLKILLCDNSKFDQKYSSYITNLSAVDFMITDELPDENYLKQVKTVTNREEVREAMSQLHSSARSITYEL